MHRSCRLSSLPRAVSILAALAALGACKHYSGPVSITPSWVVSAPVDAYVPVYGEVSSGGSPAPMVLTRFTLTCKDPTVCATQIAPGSRGAEGRVAGLRAGETDVVVTFEHPVNKVPGEARFHVVFTNDAPMQLAPGRPLPPDIREDSMMVAHDAAEPSNAAAMLSCHHDDGMPIRDLGPPYTRALAQAALFACEPPIEIIPGKKHLCLSSRMQSRWNWGDHTMETRLVCASLRGGAVEGLRTYRETPKYRMVQLPDMGKVDDAQCPTVPPGE